MVKSRKIMLESIESSDEEDEQLEQKVEELVEDLDINKEEQGECKEEDSYKPPVKLNKDGRPRKKPVLTQIRIDTLKKARHIKAKIAQQRAIERQAKLDLDAKINKKTLEVQIKQKIKNKKKIKKKVIIQESSSESSSESESSEEEVIIKPKKSSKKKHKKESKPQRIVESDNDRHYRLMRDKYFN
jgi:hypothetical protein